MAEEVHRTLKNQALKRLSSDLENQDSVEQNKRGKCSFLKPLDSSLWICENPACGTTQSTGPRFCKRCSCCICHKFDKNKDPSLWLKCTPDSGSEGSCGFSCHVECALRHGKVGVRALQVQLDGCFSCAFCGKVSSIIGTALGVGDDQPETLQEERPSLPDLNEEFHEPEAEPSTGSPYKGQWIGGLR